MSAWHRCLVAIDEARPNASLSTYVTERFTYMETYGLAKLVVGVSSGGRVLWSDAAKAVRVEDEPGGVTATWTLGGVRVRAEMLALQVGRGTALPEGAALYTVRADPPVPLMIRCGDGKVCGSPELPRAAWLRSDAVGAEGDSAVLSGGSALLTSAHHRYHVGVQASGEMSVEPGDAGGRRLAIRFPTGSGRIMLSFAKQAERSRALAGLDADGARRDHGRYYSGLLRSHIETPEKVLDTGFRSAILTLEDNWLEPYGWVECIHHWMSLWHMQQSGAADWLGQEDRSRACLLSHADHLLPGGAVPQLSPGGQTHRDFGGSNQFFLWQVAHYWHQTGDLRTIRTLAPALDRILAQTWSENDQDGDGLLAWGQQIGNQEDYVSTPYNGTSPSIEGIQMLRTRAEIARALGEGATAQECERRIGEIAARLRSALWMPDLGRYAFYTDPQDVPRMDGQYHTLIYPALYGLLDVEDVWTSLRQLRDRLTGPGGEVYCSNNFPWHAIGTWGMQAGAAQQPWAAWGLAAAGLRNETYRPLKAAAEWAMNADHRGSWPEISVETTPAYFSPPAGLYVQATIEALFGLSVDRPAGVLRIAPSFPDGWPSARLVLPRFEAVYARRGDTLEYRVTTGDAFARRLRWRLPPATVEALLMNGRPARFTVTPGVNSILLAADTAPQRSTRFTLRLRPAAWRLAGPASIAEGDTLHLAVSGCVVERADDPCGLLSSLSLASTFGSGDRSARRKSGAGVERRRSRGPGRVGRVPETVGGSDGLWNHSPGCATVTARIREGLLHPYAGFGRLGQMTFSRRTLFLACRAPGAIRFLLPVDLMVLPRYEVSAEVVAVGQGAQVLLRLRNNTGSPLRGHACLRVACCEFPFDVDVPPRSERRLTIVVPANRFALLSPGDNRGEVALPGPHLLSVTLTAARLFEQAPYLLAWARLRMTPIALPSAQLVEDTKWRDWRDLSAIVHWPWAGAQPPLVALAGKKELDVPAVPGLRFALAERKLVPISRKIGAPSVTLELGGALCRKLYLLVAPFLDNHDTFAPVARIDVQTSTGAIFSRELRFPGDLDWWFPESIVGRFSTAYGRRGDRFGLLPLLPASVGDWSIAHPPLFPQPEYWATCLPVKTASAVMNVVEIDLGAAQAVKSLTVATLGADPALGIVAVTAEAATGHQGLAGTLWMPPAELREPRLVFPLNRAGELDGWRLEGEAFSVAPVPGLFAAPTLNSLAKAGERATGRAISPPFTLDGLWLRFRFHGGHALAESGHGSLMLRLVDVGTGQELLRMAPPGSHLPQETAIPVGKWRGRTVRLELVDENADASYAWIGLSEVTLSGR